MKHALRTGVLGLQTANLRRLLPCLQPPTNGITSVTYQLDGADYAFLFDQNNRLVGEANNLNHIAKTFILSAFQPADDVLLPFQEDQTLGGYQALQLPPESCVWPRCLGFPQ